MEIISGILTREEYLRAIARAVELLLSKGVADVLVSYGFDCKCPDEQLFANVRMPLDRLTHYIQESEAAGYYFAGSYEMEVEDSKGRFNLTLCHESDIHFTSNDPNWIADMRTLWVASQYSITER